MKYLNLFTVVLVLFNLLGWIDITWFQVFIPTYIYIALWVLLVGVAACATVIITVIERKTNA